MLQSETDDTQHDFRDENQQKEETMETMKDKERDLARQLAKLSTENDLKQSEIERLQSKIETIQSYNSTLEKEISEVRG